MNKKYFIFGKEICDAYEHFGIEAARDYTKRSIGWGFFEFVDGISTPEDLLSAFDGWKAWLVIPEKDYIKLIEQS